MLLVLTSLLLTAQDQEKSKAFKPTIRDVEEIQMIYYTHIGPYMESFNDYGRLMAHIQSNNIAMGPYGLGIFYDDPELVPENKLRSEIGIMVTAPFKETEMYKFKKIPAGKAVSVRYTSMQDIYPAYNALAKFIDEKKLKTEEYSIEIYYSSDPNIVDAEILMMIID